jgi:hypothetical protein
VLSSFTHTNSGQPGGAAPDFGNNNNAALDQVSVFLAGRATDYLGGFVQATYSGTARSFHLDNTDIRLTHAFDTGDSELRLGVSVNNGPLVQDAYNSTYAWIFPFASSALAPTPTAQPLLAGGLIGNSVGTTVYAWYDRHLYLEAGAYNTLGPRGLSLIGNTLGPGATSSPAPYLRTAYEWNWNGQSAHIGAVLLYASLNPKTGNFTADGSFGRDRYLDVALDGGYQFLGKGRHVATVDAIYTHERQDLNGSLGMGTAAFARHNLNQARVNLSYFYDRTYGISLGWQNTWGTADPVLYAPAPITGSANGKPDSNAFVVELDWIPFGKADSWLRPFANLKLAAQYTAYTRFNGGGRNYDGFGRNASANNTLYLYAWLAF